MRLPYLLVIIALAIIGNSCNKGIDGDLNENQLPETYLVSDTIIRNGDDRFVSQIQISWSGTDPDGVVVGYEYSFGDDEWDYTERQDSVFLVELPEGVDTFDVSFFVRSVDNRGGVDPTPASLVYPVKNSPPTIAYAYQAGTPAQPSRNTVKTFPILKLEWKADDRDGFANIDHIEFAINDTTGDVLKISPEYSSLTLEATDPRASQSDCKIYLGTALKLQSQTLDGLLLNDTNYFYIKVYDKVGISSPFIKSRKVYVKKVVSDVLLVNGYSSSIEARENFFIDNMVAAGITDFDTLRVNEVIDDNYTSLAADNPTQAKIFSLFKVMLWFGQDAPYLLTLAQRTTGDFFDQGGRMFATVYFNSGIDPQSQYLDFTPIDSLVGAFFIDNGGKITPNINGWPELATDKIISSARPFYELSSGEPMYDAELATSGGPWEGKSTIMAKKLDNQGKAQFILCSVELYRLNANNNMDAFFSQLFKEFGL